VAEPAILALEDGTVFKGVSVGAEGRTLGEVVFNTAMTGYQEILTDPSYFRQIVTLTYPHIGNVGTNSDDFESTKIYAAGLVIRDLSALVSNFRAEGGLEQFLRRGKTVAIAEIDTRQLTRILRDKGAQAGCIVTGAKAKPDEAVKAARKFPGLKGMDLAKLVTTKQTYQWNQGSIWPDRQSVYTKRVKGFHVVAFDYGIKRNILRLLAGEGCKVTVVPATTSAEDILAMKPDGIFLSNGPGDPAATGRYAVPVIQRVIASGTPTFGICLGHQMLGLAVGAKTVKMHQGHHGANHPVKDETTGKVEITSMNHGFAVDQATLPEGATQTHISLFDGSNCGIELKGKPVFSVQYHPEASPGPRDSHYLFKRFADLMRANKRA
jgi:carbamoyl-phosphate synthase small subunit